MTYIMFYAKQIILLSILYLCEFAVCEIVLKVYGSAHKTCGSGQFLRGRNSLILEKNKLAVGEATY
jgi:hypothetical protein